MPPFLDARVPLRFAPAGRLEPDAAWLIQGDTPAPPAVVAVRFDVPAVQPGHQPDCRCCLWRSPVAEALSRLFFARVRGEVPFFRSVVALPRDQEGAAVIKAGLVGDPVLLAHFRLDPDP